MQYYTDKWDRIFKQFETRYPGLAKDVTDWYPSGRTEITMLYVDKTKFTYNSYSDAIRVIYYGDETDRFGVADGEPVGEEAWRAAFSRRLRIKMREARMTQTDLSKKSGVALSTVSRYLNNCDIVPSAYNVLRLADALSCSPSDLMDHFN